MFYKGNLQTTESKLPIDLNNDSVKKWEYKKRCLKHNLKEVSNKPDLENSSLSLDTWRFWGIIASQLNLWLVIWQWESHFTFLGLSFFTYKEIRLDYVIF